MKSEEWIRELRDALKKWKKEIEEEGKKDRLLAIASEPALNLIQNDIDLLNAILDEATEKKEKTFKDIMKEYGGKK